MNRIVAIALSVSLALSTFTAFPQAKPASYPSGTPVNYVRTWAASVPVQDTNALVNLPLSGVKQTTQYINGLGRPLQTVALGGSLATASQPTDLVAPVEYDAFSREAHKWLPYPSTGNDGSFKQDPFSEQATALTAQYASVGGDTYFYGQTDFEASPLNRPVKNYAPGNSWAGSGHGAQAGYWFNTITDDVKMWDVSAASQALAGTIRL